MAGRWPTFAADAWVAFFPLLVANAILLEAALSFLGAGVQPPEAFVGNDDRRRHRADLELLPTLTIAPGAMLAAH